MTVDSHGDYEPGTMDISQNVRSWHNFVTFVKWSMGLILVIMVFLAVFRTHG